MAARMKGVGQLRRRLRKLPDAIKDPVQQVFREEAPQMEGEMAAAAPKDEGRLGSAVLGQVSRDELAMHVGYSKKRPGFKRLWKRGGFTSLWQEFGAKQHRAQPFIGPVAERRAPAILERIKRATRQALGRASTA